MTLPTAPAGDEDAILVPARDYIESWLDGDVDRMARCLHPDLVKRAIDPESDSGVYTMSRDDMVGATASGRGTALERTYDVRVLDAFGDIATVLVLSAAYMDYLHVARFDDGWRIVNVLWQRRAEP
jgi:hypothetical protein